jgi:glucosamine--fructose-6-phosphate aminotransferase (isomerizing)
LTKKVEIALKTITDKIIEISKLSEVSKDVIKLHYILGRGYNFPVALGRSTQSLKEISYIHAEGYPAAEMKHGPIALIDQEMPVVCYSNQQ